MWRRLFGPKNSLILAYDKSTAITREELDEQLDHVAAYYKFVRLSEIVGKLRQMDANGMASVVFLSARKGLFLQILPELQARSIPVTIFADPNLIGTNRLAPEEEIAVYQKKFPELNKNASLANARAAGAFPVECADPLDFSVTWGKITEVPASLRDVGISLSSETTPGDFTQNIKFISQRVGTAPTSLYGKQFLSTINDDQWSALGVHTILGNKRGVIDKNTSRFDLPQFFFEKTQ